jgi:hypothetical protein
MSALEAMLVTISKKENFCEVGDLNYRRLPICQEMTSSEVPFLRPH